MKDDTPDVTVSPSSTPFVITTPDIGAVTRARCVTASPRDRDSVPLDDLVALARGLEALGGEVALRDVVLERLAPDEALP